MASIRQVILLREDLGLARGLSEAQVAHLHMEYLRKSLLAVTEGRVVAPDKTVEARLNLSEDFISWLKAPYTFVHGVPNLEALEYYKNIANGLRVPFEIWKDTVYLKISDTQKIVVENCLIGIVFNPIDSDRIKAIIGDLPLLS
jgi:peptidyl-tRNA hydrolase